MLPETWEEVLVTPEGKYAVDAAARMVKEMEEKGLNLQLAQGIAEACLTVGFAIYKHRGYDHDAMRNELCRLALDDLRGRLPQLPTETGG